MAARSQPLQTSWNSGVLNPDFAARTDIEHYYQGASIGDQLIFPKEGGAKGRWGTLYKSDVPGDGRLIEFEFSTEQTYVLWIGESETRFFKDGVLVANINGSGDAWLTTPWTLAQVLELNYTQSADTLVIVHPDVEPRRLVRGATDADWTLSTLPLTNIPKFDFDDVDSPAPTSHVVDLTFNAFADGDRYKVELNGFETPEIVYSITDTAANARRIKEELLLLPPTGFVEGNLTVALTAGTTYRITYAGDSADAYEDQTGRSTNNVAASITFAGVATGVPRREDVISATRGWPVSVMFYESRLWFGGTKSLPQSVLGSQIGGFFDFKLGTGLDDQGVFVAVNTDQVNAIRAVYPGRHFQMFTSGGEFYSPDRPMTPAPGLPRQSRFGCAESIRPVEVDGATIFVSKERKTIREYLFLWSEEAYNATSLTVMASHLFSNIRAMAALTSTEDEEDSYVITLNGDGTGAVLNTLRAQDVAAWARLSTRTGDKLKSVTVSGTEIFFLVERQRNGLTVYQVEQASFATRMDCSITVTTGLGTTVAGFDKLVGETVQVMVDGSPSDDQVVNSFGQLTFANAPVTSVEAGYFVPPILASMPLVPDIGIGPMLGADKRISDIRLRVKESLGIIANEMKVPDKIIGQVQTATPDQPVSGLMQIEDLGWTDEDAIITLTQDQPLPFHILALSGVVYVGRT